VVHITPEPIEEVPQELENDAYLISIRNEKGKLVPANPHYEVRVEPTEPIPMAFRNSVATAQFQLPARTLYEHIVRYVRMTFRTEVR
jgi:hypothetical protein